MGHFKRLFLVFLISLNIGLVWARVEIGNLYYELNRIDKTASVTYSYSDDGSRNYVSGDIVIQSKVRLYDGTTYPVTEIGRDAFENCTDLTSIVIPNSITKIEDGAFTGCKILTSIEIPCSVTYLSGFDHTGLTSIKIPNSVTEIGNYAFRGCTGLTSIEIPSNVTRIGGGAFSGCTGLTSVEIPNSVTEIGNYAFRGCTGLTSIEIPNSVTVIENFAFSGCTGLTSIKIPNSVTIIGGFAFQDCTGLTSIEIPNSVTIIGGYAFIGCTNLKTVINHSNLDIVKGALTHGDVANHADIVTNEAIEKDNLNFALVGNELVIFDINAPLDTKEIVIPNEVEINGVSYPVTSINCSFSEYKDLESVVIPENITNIGEYAFYGCTNLKTVTNNSNLDIEKGSETHGIESILAADYDGIYEVYNAQGMKVLVTKEKEDILNLSRGVYIVKTDIGTGKIVVK